MKGSMLIWTQKIRNNKWRKKQTDGYFLFACQSSIHSTHMMSSLPKQKVVPIIWFQNLVKLSAELSFNLKRMNNTLNTN